MKGYILQNDEQGWMDECPVFISKEEARRAAGNKCRHYSVIELDYIADCEPCRPFKKLPKCDRCTRFDGEKSRFGN